MQSVQRSHVEVYVFRRRSRGVEFLVLRRAAGQRVLPGAWQPVTGKRRRGERALRAAVREVLEETGLRPRRWWALETVTLFVDTATDRLAVLPLFAAEAGARDRVSLSNEHEAFAWLGAGEAGRRCLWESQRRGVDAVRREVLRGGALARALEMTDQVVRMRATTPARASRRQPG